jgi:two-component system, NtrC family, sensor kinase
MKRIISNLLTFAQPQHEGRRLLDMEVVVRDSLMLLEYQLRSSGINVEMKFEPNLPRISANEGQSKQVFVNLFQQLGLRVGAGSGEEDPGGRIFEGRESDHALYRFGPGFNDISRAFDPFCTTRPVGQGTGLGLSICYGTVREHTGNIYAQNLQPNGAVVTIELPVG